MLINFSLLRLIIIIFFIVFFPLIQKQWFNLYLFNKESISFYSVLYYVSGLILPLLTCFFSIRNYTFYSFNRNNININKTINGKNLLFIVLSFLIPLSFLISHYFLINISLISNLLLSINILSKFKFINYCFIAFVISIFLIFEKTRIIIKKFTLINFFIASLVIWQIQNNNLELSNNFFLNNSLYLKNLNFINIIYILIIEIFYYFWSFLSFKNNLSNWSVNVPSKYDYFFSYKILFSYLLLMIYQYILK